MASVPFWGSNDESEARTYDTVSLTAVSGGRTIKLPGTAFVNVKSQVNIDVQPIAGTRGAATVVRSVAPRSVSIVLLLQDQEAADAWVSIAPTFSVSTQKDIVAYRIEHPQCQKYGVSQVLIQALNAEHPDRTIGERVSFDLIEYFPPAPITNKVSPAKTTIVDASSTLNTANNLRRASNEPVAGQAPPS